MDKSKLFSNVRPTIYKRKSSSLGERSLNPRLLKIIQYVLKKIFEIAKWLKKNFSKVHSCLSTLKKNFKIVEWFQRNFLESAFKFICEI